MASQEARDKVMEQFKLYEDKHPAALSLELLKKHVALRDKLPKEVENEYVAVRPDEWQYGDDRSTTFSVIAKHPDPKRAEMFPFDGIYLGTKLPKELAELVAFAFNTIPPIVWAATDLAQKYHSMADASEGLVEASLASAMHYLKTSKSRQEQAHKIRQLEEELADQKAKFQKLSDTGDALIKESVAMAEKLLGMDVIDGAMRTRVVDIANSMRADAEKVSHGS